MVEETKDNVSIFQVTQIQEINRRCYGIEMMYWVNQENILSTPEIIELANGLNLEVILEGRLPTRYSCGE